MSDQGLQDALLEDDSKSRFSNQTVLAITCGSFATFVIAEIVGALASNSLALLGDAAAMSVDVFTYFTNMYAERVKARGECLTKFERYVMEVCIPTFSVTALLSVTGWITSDALDIIINGGDDKVNVYFLYGFAIANFLVDVLSSYMFYARGKEVFYHDDGTEKIPKLGHQLALEQNAVEAKTRVDFGATEEQRRSHLPPPVRVSKDDAHIVNTYITSRIERISRESTGDGLPILLKTNLNMLSAFTHVGGDTMRTVAVFVAAVVATASGASADQCDAWAAVVVTLTIIACVIPLALEIVKAHKRITGEPADTKNEA